MAGACWDVMATGSTGVPRINRAVLTQLVADLGPDQVAALTAVFVADARRGMSTVRTACASGDADAAARTAHRLKSSCGFLGADLMSTLCEEMEHMARNGRLDLLGSRLDLMSHELELASAELASVVGAVPT